MVYAKQFMQADTAVVRESSSLQQVSRVLLKNGTSGVPVVDRNRKPVGFISERDIVKAIARFGPKPMTAGEIMHRKVLTVEEDTPIEYVSKLLSEHPYRNIPVTRGNRIVGMINRKDVISNLLGHYY